MGPKRRPSKGKAPNAYRRELQRLQAQQRRARAAQSRQRAERARRRSSRAAALQEFLASSSSSMSTAQMERTLGDAIRGSGRRGVDSDAIQSSFLNRLRRRGVQFFDAREDDEFDDEDLFDDSVPQTRRMRRAIESSNRRSRRLFQELRSTGRVTRGTQPVGSREDLVEQGSDWNTERRRAVNWLRTNSRVERTTSRSLDIIIPPNASFDLLANLAIRLTSVTSRAFLLEAGGNIVTLSRANLPTFLAEASGRLGIRRGGFVGGSNVVLMGSLLNSLSASGAVLRITLPGRGGSGTRQAGSWWPFLMCFGEIWGYELLQELQSVGLYLGPTINIENYIHNCLAIAIAESHFGPFDTRHSNEKVEEWLRLYPEARAVIVSHTRGGAFPKSKISALADAISIRCEEGVSIKVTYLCGGSGRRKVHVHGAPIWTSRHRVNEIVKQGIPEDCAKIVEEFCSPPPTPLVYDIGLLQGHWFVMKKLSITSFAARNWHSIVGQPWRQNRTSQFTTTTMNNMIDIEDSEDEDCTAVVDSSWRWCVQKSANVTGETRWKTTRWQTRKCDSLTFLSILLKAQGSHPTMVPCDSLAFCFALAHKQQRALRDSEQAIAQAAMRIRKEEFTPVKPGAEGAKERRITKTLIEQKLHSREEAELYLSQKRRRGGRKGRGDDDADIPRYVFDCETRGVAQIPYLLCLDTMKECDLNGADPNRPFDFSQSRVFYGARCGQSMISYLADKHRGKKVFIFAHNATYDIRQSLLGQLSNVTYGDIVFRGSSQSMISISITFKKTTLVFRDTYCHLSCPLSKCPKAFGIDNPNLGKEVMPYDTYDDLPEDGCAQYDGIRDQIKAELGADDFQTFETNCNSWDCFYESATGETFIDMYKYSAQYCRIDCALLARVFSIYRSTFYDLTKQCAFKCLTVTSIGQRWLLAAGTYDGAYSLAAPQRRYVQQAVVGGRTSLAIDPETNRARKSKTWAGTPELWRKIENNEIDFEGKLEDYVSGETVEAIDMNSCYPYSWTTLSRRLGVPKGIPESHETISFADLTKKMFWFATVTVDRVTRHSSSLPVMSFKDDNGTRQWRTPAPDSSFIINNVDCELWMSEGVVFKDKVRWALTWDERVSFDSASMIERLYEERKRCKRTARGNCIKLLLNSIYGRTIMKPPESTCEILTATSTEIYRRLSKSYQTLIQCLKIGRSHSLESGEEVFTWFIKRATGEHTYQNLCHFGSLILSESKRNMQRGLQHLEKHGPCPGVLYTDTDSYMVKSSYITPDFLQAFMGNQLGDLSNDIDPAPVPGKIIGESTCIWSIFLAKKIYLMVNITPYFHEGKYRLKLKPKIRLKGVPDASILARAASEFGQGLFGIMALFEKLAKEPIEFDLCCDRPRLIVDQQSQRFEKITSFTRRVTIA